MKITIHGSGYVGLVAGACLADVGHAVVCVEVDARKLEMLARGEVPFYEPGLAGLVTQNLANGRLRFTGDSAAGVRHGLVQFIAVGTPSKADGGADLKYVEEVARAIGRSMTEYRLIACKSTVPVGTGDRVQEIIEAELAGQNLPIDFDVASNPEFLKEGAAIGDFTKPDRIVVGTTSTRALDLFREIYFPFNRNHDRLMSMSRRSAELTKYAANAMLATKISFINEVANIAERVGADIEQVRLGIGSDSRIGYHFIYPGMGYGGSCFPKDVRALLHTSRAVGFEPQLMQAVEAVNHDQKRVLFTKINHRFGGELKGKTIAIWGLAFKPNTDDIREAASGTLIEQLLDAGAKVQTHDPEAMDRARAQYSNRVGISFHHDYYEAATGADALAIVTEWKQFRSPDWSQLKGALRLPIVFDGRNIFDPEMIRRMGFEYYPIGRAQGPQL